MPWARIVATRMSVILSCDGSDARRTAFSIVPVADIVFLISSGAGDAESAPWKGWKIAGWNPAGIRLESGLPLFHEALTPGGWRGLAKAGRR
jgi:hypothetical protein